MSISVGGLVFPTKAAMYEHARSILNCATLDMPIVHPHTRFVEALLRLHPHADDKIGVGIRYIEVRTNKPYNSRSFWIVRLDGSATDFSYRMCGKKESSHRSDVLAAMRAEVAGFVRDFLMASPVPRDVITNEPLELSDCDVEHMPPKTFVVLAERFLSERRMTVDDVAVTGGDGAIGCTLTDRRLANDWYVFHKREAELCVLSRETHKEMTRRWA